MSYLGGVSVIVPLLNEEVMAPQLIEQLAALDAEQVIIVDGGSTDSTCHLMQSAGYQVVQSVAGRAQQMNAGAQHATQSILLFLHADTQLPPSYKSEIAKAKAWGRFDVSFSSQSKAMSVVAFFMNLRSRVSGVATGDQGIFVDKDVFSAIGGFPELPLMEDVALCKRLRQIHRPFNSNMKVVTSARRWQQNGIFKTVVTMWWYRLGYFLGMSPMRFKKGYEDVR